MSQLKDFAAEWKDLADCKKYDHMIWFPEPGEHDKLKKARSICSKCPVKKQCLEYAVETNQTIGIWGALSSRQLRAERKRRRLQKNNIIVAIVQ
jgi:WhiB family redox-sensing transcriptional regulator